MTQAQGHLRENVAYISRYNRGIEQALNCNFRLEDFELAYSASNDPILFYKSLALDSKNDPAKAAELLFDKVAIKDNPDAIHILVGIGTGYAFKTFVAKAKGRVILVELKPEILRMTLDLVDFTEELCRRSVLAVSNVKEVMEALAAFYKEDVNITFTPIDSYQKMVPEVMKKLEDDVLALVPEKYEGGPLNLNIGPGKWGKKGWKKLDCYNSLTNFDVDLRKMTRFPLEDNVIEKAFSSHCIEHIEDHHLDVLIKELYRCMAPGGILRLSCPDADQALEAYKTGNKKWFWWLPQKSLEKMIVNTFVSYEHGGPEPSDDEVKEKFETLDKEAFIRWCISLADRTRPYIAHINGHYFDKIRRKLSDEGFIDIKRSAYRESEDEELRGEKFDLYPEFSLYVECKKPV